MENDASPAQVQSLPPPPIIPVNPPPLLTPPPPRPPRRGRGWMKAAIVLAVLLGISVLSNLRQVTRGVTGRGRPGRPADERP
jgi:hypothetical protein